MQKSNQIRVAFTWPWNTGKSTIINKLKEELSNSIGDNQWCKEYNVTVYPETARTILDDEKLYKDCVTDWEFNMARFQANVSDLEDLRAEQIKEDTSEILLIDRTAMDWLVYSIFNLENWMVMRYNQDNIWEYDLVILFTEAFKETQTEQFAHYNDDRLVKLFKNIINYVYWDKVVEFKNAWDIKDIKKLIYSKLNNRE